MKPICHQCFALNVGLQSFVIIGSLGTDLGRNPAEFSPQNVLADHRNQILDQCKQLKQMFAAADPMFQL